MDWNESFPKLQQPTLAQMDEHVGSPIWQELRERIETGYQLKPLMEHSRCSCSPGWNIKYRMRGRALCTLYPHDGCFTCLLAIGAKQAQEAELALSACGKSLQEQYWSVKPFNGARWLMIDVDSPERLRELLILLQVRAGAPLAPVDNPLPD